MNFLSLSFLLLSRRTLVCDFLYIFMLFALSRSRCSSPAAIFLIVSLSIFSFFFIFREDFDFGSDFLEEEEGKRADDFGAVMVVEILSGLPNRGISSSSSRSSLE